MVFLSIDVFGNLWVEVHQLPFVVQGDFVFGGDAGDLLI
jgi:hypothetical protein